MPRTVFALTFTWPQLRSKVDHRMKTSTLWSMAVEALTKHKPTASSKYHKANADCYEFPAHRHTSHTSPRPGAETSPAYDVRERQGPASTIPIPSLTSVNNHVHTSHCLACHFPRSPTMSMKGKTCSMTSTSGASVLTVQVRH